MPNQSQRTPLSGVLSPTGVWASVPCVRALVTLPWAQSAPQKSLGFEVSASPRGVGGPQEAWWTSKRAGYGTVLAPLAYGTDE